MVSQKSLSKWSHWKEPAVNACHTREQRILLRAAKSELTLLPLFLTVCPMPQAHLCREGGTSGAAGPCQEEKA